MIGYYFIQNKYIFVDNKDKEKDIDINRNDNDKYKKEMTSQLVKNSQQVPSVPLVPPIPPAVLAASAAPQVSGCEESFDTEDNENENLIHNNKNKITKAYKKLLNYIF